jgi:hypothetical protein
MIATPVTYYIPRTIDLFTVFRPATPLPAKNPEQNVNTRDIHICTGWDFDPRDGLGFTSTVL